MALSKRTSTTTGTYTTEVFGAVKAALLDLQYRVLQDQHRQNNLVSALLLRRSDGYINQKIKKITKDVSVSNQYGNKWES